jgi:uncharacterized membrane protein YbhN (UPF0104 family)
MKTPKSRGLSLVLAILTLVGGVIAVGTAAFALAGARLASGRPGWLVSAAGLELLSVIGFVAIFQLVFSEWLPRGRQVRMGLAVRSATTLLPAGGLLAIGLRARAIRKDVQPGMRIAPRAVAFVLITNAPNLIVLATVGLALGLGLLPGPHGAILTVVPAAIALGVIGATIALPNMSHWRGGKEPRRLPGRLTFFATKQSELGVLEVRSLLAGRNWKLLGALAYYAADNAVLWATFEAFGHSVPPLAILAMAYLIGSAAGSIPTPAGIGVVEGGMIGALVLYGAPVACAGVAVLGYRAISTGVPLVLAGVAVLGLRSGTSPGPAAPEARTVVPVTAGQA